VQVKEHANSALKRVTGYQLTREPGKVDAERRREFDEELDERLDQALEGQRRKMAREVERLTKEVNRMRRRSRQSKNRIPSYVDDTTRDILKRSQPRTLTGLAKLLPLVDAVRYTVEHQIPGAAVECGVWRGGSMQAVAWTLLDAGVDDRDLYLYDTFEGMSQPTEDDVQTRTRATAADLLSRGKAMCIADLDDVQQGMSETGYPMDRIHFHPGKVEDTIPEHTPEQIALLRLDTDWYESTKHELEHLYPRLSPGGVLIIDDFGSWDGARKATLEWLQESGEQLLLVPIGAARIAVKPG
jgi:O-methyltransferase